MHNFFILMRSNTINTGVRQSRIVIQRYRCCCTEKKTRAL